MRVKVKEVALGSESDQGWSRPRTNYQDTLSVSSSCGGFKPGSLMGTAKFRASLTSPPLWTWMHCEAFAGVEYIGSAVNLDVWGWNESRDGRFAFQDVEVLILN